MKVLDASLVLIVSSVIGLVTAQEFTLGRTGVFPVVFYVSNQCKEFWARPTTNVTADGQCNYVPPSQYTDMIGPGPYYRALCSDDGGYVKFIAAGCLDSTCADCARFSVYTNGTSKGVFDMTNLGCQDLQVSSFVSYGPLDVRAESESVPETVPVPPPPVQTPLTPAPTAMPVEVAAAAPVEVPSPMPVEVATPMPVPPPTPLPDPVIPCRWQLKYYNRTYSDVYSAYPTCSKQIYNLVAPQQRASIIADGVCRDSGISSVGFYQAICNGNDGLVFLKNKCVDATCETCDPVPEIYTRVSYMSDVCMDKGSNPLQAWILKGDCSRPSCAVMTRSASTFSLTSP